MNTRFIAMMNYILLPLILFWSCRLTNDSKNISAEQQLIKEIQGEYDCQVKIYYSDNPLKNSHPETYSISIHYIDSTLRGKLKANTRKWASYIDSVILKDNKTARKINFQLINSFNNGKFQATTFVRLNRDTLSKLDR